MRKMERATLFNEFKEVLAEHISANAKPVFEKLNEQTNMADDLLIESLDIVNIVIDVENKFNIEIDNDSIKRMTTVGNCVSLIQEKLCSRCEACKIA